jgi:hypothetical protein
VLQDIDLATQTMFAELQQRCLDAEFDKAFDARGTFYKKALKGREYWYYQRRSRGRLITKYAGPAEDPAITDRVNRFSQIKSDYRRRRQLVRALTAAGLPTPNAISGAVTEAMWKAGFFRQRGVLVGTLAFQAYAGTLGVRLGGRALMTQDADFAQFWGVSENVNDSMKAPLEVLQDIDPTFRPVPNIDDPFVSVQYRNGAGYRVDFLTPNRGSDEHQGKPAKMKALAGTGAQPLRHLDFLSHQPERSLLLYGGGVPVTVPRAERFAVHKLIVAAERQDQAKSAKDLLQAQMLIETLAVKRPRELASAWRAAGNTGTQWQEKLKDGRARLPTTTQQLLPRYREEIPPTGDIRSAQDRVGTQRKKLTTRVKD